MAVGVVVSANVLHSSRGKHEECASGSGFVVHLGGASSLSVVLTTASWLIHMWATEEDGHSHNLFEMWIKDNVSFSVIAQREGSKCTRPQPASLLTCILLKNVNQTLLDAFPHSEYFGCRPTPSSLLRGPSRTSRLTECLSSVLVLRVDPPCAGTEGGCLPALKLSPLSPPPLHTGDEVVVQATPLGDACPDIFINSMIRGSICGCHGDVLILDAPCPVGCEGGVVMRSSYCEGNTLQLASSLTGLGLAVDLSVVSQAVMDVVCTRDRQPGVIGSTGSHLVPHRSGSHLVPHRSGSHLVPHYSVAHLVCGVLSSSSSWGAGVVLDRHHVLTCAHVVGGRSRVELLMQEGYRVEARAVFACHAGNSLDVAILQANVPLSSGMTLMDYWSISSRENGCYGDKIIVAGYPLHQPSVQHRVPLLTSGCVSKVHYWEDVPVMYQVTAAVHSGCSGGIVVAMDTHQPIGMVTSVVIDNSTGRTCPHISFVLPLSFINEHIQAFLRSRDIEHLVAMGAKGENPAIKHIWRLSIEAALKCVQSKL